MHDSPAATPEVYIHTTSDCVQSRNESHVYAAYFRRNGWAPTRDPARASLMLCNTCGMVPSREDDSVRAIQNLIAVGASRGASVVVTGCLPAINLRAIRDVHDGPVLDLHRIDELDGLIGASMPLRDVRREVRALPDASGVGMVRVATGCDSRCTFCAIRAAKGATRSVPIPDIVTSVRRELENGVDDLVLLGDDLASYGSDIGGDIAELLSALLAIPGWFTLGLDNLYPGRLLDLHGRLGPLLRDPRVARLNIPLQAGSSRILKLMGRPYDVPQLLATLHCLRHDRSAAPIVLTTHLILGFPSETSMEFEQGLDAISSFDRAVVLTWAPRPGAPAANFPGQLPRAEKIGRLARAKALFGDRPGWTFVDSEAA